MHDHLLLLPLHNYHLLSVKLRLPLLNSYPNHCLLILLLHSLCLALRYRLLLLSDCRYLCFHVYPLLSTIRLWFLQDMWLMHDHLLLLPLHNYHLLSVLLMQLVQYMLQLYCSQKRLLHRLYLVFGYQLPLLFGYRYWCLYKYLLLSRLLWLFLLDRWLSYCC